MANGFNFQRLLKPKASVSRNGFDLSQKHVFSSVPGQVLPVAAVETVPNDYFEFDLGAISRTRTFNTAAMIKGKFSYEFFAVPYSQIWHNFNQFYSQRQDKHSTAYGAINYTPVVQLADLLDVIYSYKAQDDMMGAKYGRGMCRVLDMLGYGNFFPILSMSAEEYAQYKTDSKVGEVYVNIFRLAAYQHICYDRFRDKIWDVDNDFPADGGVEVEPYSIAYNVKYWNFDDVACNSFATADITTSALTTSNRLAGLMALRYVPWKKDIFTSSLPNTQYGAVSSISLGNVSLELDLSHNHTADDHDGHYLYTGRQGGEYLPTGDDKNWRSDDTDLAGVDAASVFSDNTPPLTDYVPTGIGTIHDNTAYPAKHNHDVNMSSVADRLSVNGQTSYGLDDTSYEGSLSGGFDMLQLRKAELLQRWKQNTLRAGNMVDDQFRAHLGVAPSDEHNNNVMYLGSYDFDLDVNPVTATATTGETDNGTVGDLAGTGYAMRRVGNKIKFKADFFGVVICVCYFRPDAEYMGMMLDKANRLFEQFDFFTPEFENAGLEPLTQVDFCGGDDFARRNQVLGYVPPYWQYKTAVNKVHNGFFDYNNGGNDYSGYFEHGLAHWVAPRTDGVLYVDDGTVVGRDVRSFYVPPTIYDTVFGVSASEADCFINNVYVQVSAIRPMSELGIPQF